MKIFSEAKYLEPPMPFRSFVRHISKHLPKEVQISLMTREIANISELENILDVFQNIRDQEISRRHNQPSMNNGGNHGPQRGPPHGQAYPRREQNN